MNPYLEETIDRWNSRTQIMKNIASKGQQNKVFNKTILEQVNQLLNDEESKRKVIEKT